MNGPEESMSQYASYNQRNNSNKTFINTPNQGNMSTFNSNINVSLRPDDDKPNVREYASTSNINVIPSADTYGNINMPQDMVNQSADRMNPDILTAFKNNPYTHSLSSWS